MFAVAGVGKNGDVRAASTCSRMDARRVSSAIYRQAPGTSRLRFEDSAGGRANSMMSPIMYRECSRP
jgi:hypothetical protein